MSSLPPIPHRVGWGWCTHDNAGTGSQRSAACREGHYLDPDWKHIHVMFYTIHLADWPWMMDFVLWMWYIYCMNLMWASTSESVYSTPGLCVDNLSSPEITYAWTALNKRPCRYRREWERFNQKLDFLLMEMKSNNIDVIPTRISVLHIFQGTCNMMMTVMMVSPVLWSAVVQSTRAWCQAEHRVECTLKTI